MDSVSSSDEGPVATERVSRGLESSGNRIESTSVETEKTETLWGATLVDQVVPMRFSSLIKLCGVVGYVRRAGKKWLAYIGRVPMPAKWEAVLTVRELNAAFQDLSLDAQKGVTLPVTTLNRHVVSRDKPSGLLRCHGRVQAVTQRKTGVPLLTYEGVAGTLLQVRSRAWLVQGRRVTRNIIDSCIHCRKIKMKMCKEVMSELPLERIEPAALFEFTALDLYGPYVIRDTVRRRAKMKV